MSVIKIVLAASAFAALASVGAAAPLSDLSIGTRYYVKGGTGSVFGPSPELYRSGSVTNGSTTISASAGLFKLEGDKLGDSVSWEDFVAFCITVDGSLDLPDYYTVKVPGSTLSPTSKIENMNRLWNGAFSLIDTRDEAAAFQLALWELDKETVTTSPFAISGTVSEKGNFFASGFSDAVLNLANDWLGYINDDTFKDTKQAFAFLSADDRGSQDLLTPIPLPAAGLMLFGAIGALGFTSRRRKVAAEA